MNPLNLFRPKDSAVAGEPTQAGRPTVETLEDVLLELAKWGQPRVGQYGSNHNGWHCCVEVNVTPVGVKFEAKSDFNVPTPLAAALQCRANLLAAVKAIGGAA
jgi:hypothetical protein